MRERKRVEAVEEGKGARHYVTWPRKALSRFLAQLEQVERRAQARIDYYRQHLRTMFAELAPKPMPQWAPSDFAAYLASHPKWSERRVQIAFRVARRFIGWAADSNVACPDFVGKLRAPTPPADTTQALTAKDARALEKAAKGQHYLDVAVTLALHAGLSLSDLYALQWETVDLDEGWITYRRSKSKRNVRVPIEPALDAALRRHRALAGLVPHTLPKSRRSLGKAPERLCDAAGVSRGGWHRLRHTCAERWRAKGVDHVNIGVCLALPASRSRKRDA